MANWYIHFYIYALMALPALASVLRKNPLRNLLAIIALCGMLTYINTSSNIYMRALCEWSRYTPLLAIGYVCAKTNILSTLSVTVRKRFLWIVITILTMVVRCGISGVLGIVSDVVTVPVFVISVAGAFQGLENTVWARLFVKLGCASTMMWFVHALPFSDATRMVFQDTLFWTNNIIILFVTVVAASYLLSEAFEFVWHIFTKSKTKL